MKLDAVTTRWLASHVGLGALLGVLILHPATTAIYWWFETPDETLRHFVAQRLVQAFETKTMEAHLPRMRPPRQTRCG